MDSQRDRQPDLLTKNPQPKKKILEEKLNKKTLRFKKIGEKFEFLKKKSDIKINHFLTDTRRNSNRVVQLTEKWKNHTSVLFAGIVMVMNIQERCIFATITKTFCKILLWWRPQKVSLNIRSGSNLFKYFLYNTFLCNSDFGCRPENGVVNDLWSDRKLNIFFWRGSWF